MVSNQINYHSTNLLSNPIDVADEETFTDCDDESWVRNCEGIENLQDVLSRVLSERQTDEEWGKGNQYWKRFSCDEVELQFPLFV